MNIAKKRGARDEAGEASRIRSLGPAGLLRILDFILRAVISHPRE